MFILTFFVFLGACFAAGATGAMFPPGPWYDKLQKPGWTPPNWMFPVAWTVLYVCMALAGARLAALDSSGFALALWALQIALNTLWTPVFFGLRRIGAGLAVLSLLWLSVAVCVLVFWQIDLLAGLLFAPYLLWVTVAFALNLAVWRLN